MPANGELNKRLGVYRTLCCDAEMIIALDAVFPDCPNHTNLPTQWKAMLAEDPTTYVPNVGQNHLGRKK